MTKLIKAYQTTPNDKTKAALIKYLDKHPMAMAMASDEDMAVIRQAKA